MNEKVKTTFKVLKIILVSLLTLIISVLLCYNIIALIQRFAFNKKIPVVFGVGFSVVGSGSMAPTLNTNDFIAIVSGEYGVGDVVTFYDEAKDEYVTHRIISIDGNSVTTKGDANASNDDPIQKSAIIGKVVKSIGGMGSIVAILQKPTTLLILVFCIIIIWFIMGFLKKKGKNEV